MQPNGPKIPTLTILSHPDVDRVGDRATLWGEDAEQGEASLSRWELEFAAPGGGRRRPLDDPYLSRRPIHFAAARFGGIRIDCSKTGTRVIANDDWISEDRVFLGVEVNRGVVLVLSERLALLLHNLDPSPDEEIPGFGLVGDSSLMLAVRREIRRLCGEELPVLLRGAAGSGKKAVARAIHQAGRQDRPFVTVRFDDDTPPSTVSEKLVEAAGGTLVLDAVDEIGAEVQTELLRALEATARQNIRLLVAADHRSRNNSAGPLIEKLAPQTLDIPPLAQRRDDVGRLVFHFLREKLAELEAGGRLDDPGPYAEPWLPVRLVASLVAYEWPRNVRQLRRVTRQLAVDHHEREQVEITVDLEDLLEGTVESSTWGWDSTGREQEEETRDPTEISEIELLSALRTHRWQAEPTAAHLGVDPATLFEMIEKFSEESQRRKSQRRKGGAV